MVGLVGQKCYNIEVTAASCQRVSDDVITPALNGVSVVIVTEFGGTGMKYF